MSQYIMRHWWTWTASFAPLWLAPKSVPHQFPRSSRDGANLTTCPTQRHHRNRVLRDPAEYGDRRARCGRLARERERVGVGDLRAGAFFLPGAFPYEAHCVVSKLENG